MYNTQTALMFGLLAVVMIFFIKDQIFINDDQYLSSMIELHQQSIDMSDKIKLKTTNPVIKEYADKISTNYRDDIIAFKSNIKSYKQIIDSI